MRIHLPAVFVNSFVRPSLGVVRQQVIPEEVAEGNLTACTVGKNHGHALLGGANNVLVYLFAERPRPEGFGPEARVLVAKGYAAGASALDLTTASWFRHPDLPVGVFAAAPACQAARESWKGAFRFAGEGEGIIGLRKPQLGALHAIHAHWSKSGKSGTIVMPTGTGKTETMLATLTSAVCSRLFVVVPTDALRTQVAGKFETLGFLKASGSVVLAAEAMRPVVGTLNSRPTTVEAVNDFFRQCNVVVTTSNLIAGCSHEVQDRIAELCSHLFIDEAHHAEAPTWKSFRERFHDKLVLQFTATPFREDGQKVDGQLVYVYPLRLAQTEGYFRPIRFRPVFEFNQARGDQKIAEAAVEELRADITGKHVVMARVGTRPRATDVLTIYQAIGEFNPVVIHSGLLKREQDEAKAKLFSGASRIVICVDMLGEGFDMPELKIAAFHDVRKSLAITLQLAGRFTRTRADLGNAVFIANTALVNVAEELRSLYAQDPDWNTLLPEMSTAAIDAEVASQEFFQGFGTFLDEIPLKDLRPAASMVVYKTGCTNWTPGRYRHAFSDLKGNDRLYHSLNEVQNTLVILAAYEQPVIWSDVDTVEEVAWELFIASWDRERALLYIHGSGKSGNYSALAKAICEDSVSLLVAPIVYRAFHGVKRLVLNNVGLEEHMGRQVRYTGRMGSDVETRISVATRQTTTRSVMAGRGFEAGGLVTVGAAKKGRVWSALRLRVDTFVQWARKVGAKLIDETIDPDAVLAGTLKPRVITAIPAKVAISADWPEELLLSPEGFTVFQAADVTADPLTGVEMAVVEREPDGPLVLRVFTSDWFSDVRLEIFEVEGGADFRFVHVDGPEPRVIRGRKTVRLAELFTTYPPTIWFADGSSLEGVEYVELPGDATPPYPVNRLQAVDWKETNTRTESQGEERTVGTIQHTVIQQLQADASYAVIFDDDGAGEAADIVAIKIVETEAIKCIEVEFYHLKYAGGDPGARVGDLYEVCGQAQKSVHWMRNGAKRTELFVHLLKRNASRIDAGRPSRFERGAIDDLIAIRDRSRHTEVKLRMYIVQPGLSQRVASASQLTLLAVTERYLTETYGLPLEVWCSN